LNGSLNPTMLALSDINPRCTLHCAPARSHYISLPLHFMQMDTDVVWLHHHY